MIKHRFIWIFSFLLTATGVVGALVLYMHRSDISRSLERATLPQAVDYQQAVASMRPSVAPAASPVITPAAPSIPFPAEINLAVPFTVQAPHAIWEEPYKEFCEEASALMAASYVLNESLPSADVADAKLLAIKEFEATRFGYWQDTTAAETAIVLREYFKIKDVALIEQPTVNDIKQALSVGKLVIMPAAGQQLYNPYFRAPGPPYHMLVIKGYTADGRFITNDPGTRHGADYIYDEAIIMNAMHDWRSDGKVELGRKVILVVG